MEKMELTKRVYELQPGDIFWFSGNWREVAVIDRDLGDLYFKTGGHDRQSIRANSQMMVAVKEKPQPLAGGKGIEFT